SDQEPGQPLTTTAGIPLNVAVSRNNALIAAGNDQGSLMLWDAATGAPRPVLRSDLKVIGRVALNDDGSLLAAAGLPDAQNNVSIELWDTSTGTKRQTLIGSRGLITGMAFQPGRGILAAADLEGALRLWNPQDGQLVRTISAQENQRHFVGIAFSPDG